MARTSHRQKNRRVWESLESDSHPPKREIVSRPMNDRFFTHIVLPLCALFASAAPISAQSPEDSIRLNEIQVIGTHNSYHIAPPKPVMELIAGISQSLADSIAYTHKPLGEQLGALGMRQLEWDLYADPKGGLFAEPAARKMIAERGGDLPGHDPDGVFDAVFFIDDVAQKPVVGEALAGGEFEVLIPVSGESLQAKVFEFFAQWLAGVVGVLHGFSWFAGGSAGS